MNSDAVSATGNGVKVHPVSLSETDCACTNRQHTKRVLSDFLGVNMLLFWVFNMFVGQFNLKEGTSGLFLQICVHTSQVCSFDSSGGLSHLECFGQLRPALSPWEEVKS